MKKILVTFLLFGTVQIKPGDNHALEDTGQTQYDVMLKNIVKEIDETHLPRAHKESLRYTSLGIVSGAIGLASMYCAIKSNSRNLGTLAGVSCGTTLRAFYLSYATIAAAREDREIAKSPNEYSNNLSVLDQFHYAYRYTVMTQNKKYTPEKFGFFDLT